MMRRGQAAVEFLITYGWAIMVILGAIATLGYMGIFNLDAFVVEQCEFTTGIYCIDHIARSDGVALMIQNGMAVDIENVEVYVPDCDDIAANGPGSLSSGEQGEYTLDCTLPSAIFKSTIIFNYTNPDSGFNHTKIGRMTYRVN
jgi:hypothetical protein